MAYNPDDPSSYEKNLQPLPPADVRTIDRSGGTILHTSRTNPSAVAFSAAPDFLKTRYPSEEQKKDFTTHIIDNLNHLKIDAVVPIGGDDITIVAMHTQGCNDRAVHEGLMEALRCGARQAAEEGLYGAGQNLYREAFSGAVKGLGPGIAEMCFEERPNEAFLVPTADKTRPGAFNLPFYLAFADPMVCAGLLLSKKLHQGFRFVIMDVAYAAHDRVVSLEAPQDLYDIAALLRSPERFAIETIFSRTK